MHRRQYAAKISFLHSTVLYNSYPHRCPRHRVIIRLDVIEDEITDERAELVATAGLLNQNDKLREQIQTEEREKLKVEFESELVKVRTCNVPYLLILYVP